jgi:hypothetical protein
VDIILLKQNIGDMHSTPCQTTTVFLLAARLLTQNGRPFGGFTVATILQLLVGTRLGQPFERIMYNHWYLIVNVFDEIM